MGPVLAGGGAVSRRPAERLVWTAPADALKTGGSFDPKDSS